MIMGAREEGTSPLQGAAFAPPSANDQIRKFTLFARFVNAGNACSLRGILALHALVTGRGHVFSGDELRATDANRSAQEGKGDLRRGESVSVRYALGREKKGSRNHWFR